MARILATPVRRNIGVLALILCVLIAGTWAAVKLTADHLLYQSATATADNWARYLAESLTDLEQIAAGEQPSTASMVFLKSAGRSGVVFRYEIFNRHGFSQLVSEHDNVVPADLSEFNAEAARSLRENHAIVDARDGNMPGEPSYFARAYVPVMVDGKPVAIVAAYVNETNQRDTLYRTFSIAAASLCLLTTLSFVIPAIGWYRRTREKQQADRRIRYLAHHDALTGLTNRARLGELLERQLSILSASDRGLALHFIDLDRFKEVNDTLGHDGGDFLLKTIAERLQEVTREGDIVARLGGDEFVVVQVDTTERASAEEFAQRLMSAAATPVLFKNQVINPGITVGVALAPSDGNTPERVIKSADLALYNGKKAGRNCVRFFTTEMDDSMQARVRIEKIIRETLATDAFELHYQPVFKVRGYDLAGFEALLRLPAGDGTLIPPAVFIPIAEDMRVIDRIGQWVLREACRTAMQWPNDLTISVNLSPAQFEGASISVIVAEVLRETELDSHRLELEITESLLLGNSERTLVELNKLKAMGIAIVMDDFGTGYSSLSYLWQFPFDKIKIDRSFMQGLADIGRDAATVVKTIIALGRELQMRVTVEGVETQAQTAFLEIAKADLVQGFYFGKPLPSTELAAVISKHLKPTEIADAHRRPNLQLVASTADR